jgi:hypothetical protein
MNDISRKNWEKVDALTEEDIDTSDIPPLTEEFLVKSRWWKPVSPLNRVVFEWQSGSRSVSSSQWINLLVLR